MIIVFQQVRTHLILWLVLDFNPASIVRSRPTLGLTGSSGSTITSECEIQKALPLMAEDPELKTPDGVLSCQVQRSIQPSSAANPGSCPVLQGGSRSIQSRDIVWDVPGASSQNTSPGGTLTRGPSHLVWHWHCYSVWFWHEKNWTERTSPNVVIRWVCGNKQQQPSKNNINKEIIDSNTNHSIQTFQYYGNCKLNLLEELL